MPYFIAWCGFVGAWLLFAGPAYQAVLDFQEEEFDPQAFDLVRSAVVVEPVSRWWLLLPPVWFVRKQRQHHRYQRRVMELMPTEQQERFVRFSNISTAWMFVAGGALLIAVKETWDVAELYGWPVPVFVGVTVVALALCVVYLVFRERLTKRVLGEQHAEPTQT